MNPLSSFDPDEIESRPRKIARKKGQKDNEVFKVLQVYRIVTGHEKDEGWNRFVLPLHARFAKDLINYLGSWKDAANCIQDTVEAIINWNPEANISLRKILADHAPNWKMKNQENIEKQKGLEVL